MTVSSFGDWLGFLATTALAAQLVDSFQGRAYATGGVLVFRLLPAVLLGPVAGAFADRWEPLGDGDAPWSQSGADASPGGRASR